MRYKRITASILDILIFMILFLSIVSIIPMSSNAAKLTIQINSYTNKSLFELTGTERNQLMDLIYSLDRETSYIYVIAAFLIVAFFVLIPYWLNGKTLGQYIRKVKLNGEIEEKVTLNQYIIRALINSGLFLLLIIPLFIYICDSVWYSIVASILYLIQFIYWVISFFMLIIKKRTIHDYITKTKVIEVKR